MKELLRMIQLMIENVGDYDLLCVQGLIEDKFLEAEKREKEDFALNFSEWLIYQDITLIEKGLFIDEDGENVTFKDLLEIYNKELCKDNQ